MSGTYGMLDMTVYGRQEQWEDSPEDWPQPFATDGAQFREARVSRDNVQAKTGETNRELAGPTCAVQDAGVGRKGLHEVAGCRD